jgi:hypothetical protein
VQAVYDEYIAAVTAKAEEASDAALPAAVVGDARATALAQMVKESVVRTQKHIALVKNGQYAFVQWEPSYTRNADEQEAWDDMSVQPAMRLARACT